jgi:hypothetical protein
MDPPLSLASQAVMNQVLLVVGQKFAPPTMK